MALFELPLQWVTPHNPLEQSLKYIIILSLGHAEYPMEIMVVRTSRWNRKFIIPKHNILNTPWR